MSDVLKHKDATNTATLDALLGERHTHSEQETFHFGERLGACLTGGEVLLLHGTLGAGKTILVKGIATALGYDAREVTSPTFTLVNTYHANLTLYHLDLYRLDEGFAAAHAVDLEELLSDERHVVVIEWAARIADYPLPASTWDVTIETMGETERVIRIAPHATIR
ncbi:MAG: tRNA (adenosine(37)-N6)-threonylcarbamoyltransferase complex ATPase subunit type 1 TsaE [Pyrinomonadaceae bacterium MAG19_C2-C3]|nr:tRNA (adenosine(37)-N6)-threonylcarbamoyltransferase complex ATPase subunit type 1 TsaE [Pyrinomonadaceae bacterium MAG19_C2-C3]